MLVLLTERFPFARKSINTANHPFSFKNIISLWKTSFIFIFNTDLRKDWPNVNLDFLLSISVYGPSTPETLLWFLRRIMISLFHTFS